MFKKLITKGPELGLNILFVGIHKELIDAYDKQIDVARKMINQFNYRYSYFRPTIL